MAVQKSKRSKSRCGHNNAHSALKSVNYTCDKNGNFHLPHQAFKAKDGNTYYKGEIIIAAKNKTKDKV